MLRKLSVRRRGVSLLCFIKFSFFSNFWISLAGGLEIKFLFKEAEIFYIFFWNGSHCVLLQLEKPQSSNKSMWIRWLVCFSFSYLIIWDLKIDSVNKFENCSTMSLKSDYLVYCLNIKSLYYLKWLQHFFFSSSMIPNFLKSLFFPNPRRCEC